jgi:hypothetical protein
MEEEKPPRECIVAANPLQQHEERCCERPRERPATRINDEKGAPKGMEGEDVTKKEYAEEQKTYRFPFGRGDVLQAVTRMEFVQCHIPDGCILRWIRMTWQPLNHYIRRTEGTQLR